MKKDKDDTKRAPRDEEPSRGVVREWHRLFARLRDTLDWALDIAKKLARHDDEEIEAIERTRGYIHAWLAGRPAEIDMNDVLTTLAIIFAAIELDVGIDSVAVLRSLRSVPTFIHLPGAPRDERGTVVIRRFLPHRNACGSLFPQFATA